MSKAAANERLQTLRVDGTTLAFRDPVRVGDQPGIVGVMFWSPSMVLREIAELASCRLEGNRQSFFFVTAPGSAAMVKTARRKRSYRKPIAGPFQKHHEAPLVFTCERQRHPTGVGQI